MADCGPESGPGDGTQEPQKLSMVPIYRVTVMSWCFQFLLDLLWIPLAAYFKDLGWGLHILGAVFAVNLGARVLPNVAATRAGVKSDLSCMVVGLVCFALNFVFPTEPWAIFVMSAGGGLTFVRAHLSVHGKMASGGDKDRLTLASKWCGAARNAGTVVAFAIPVILYEQFGWTLVVLLAMSVIALYLVLAFVQHASGAAVDKDEGSDEALSSGIIEAPCESIPWIDWVMAGAFCATELQMNVQAAAVPTTLMRTFGMRVSLVGSVQALGQVVAMGFLMLLSRGYFSFLQKRPLNLVLAFGGTFVGMSALWAGTVLQTDQVLFIIGSLYFFYISAYTAQVTMLECLMGVLDMKSSIIVMGVAEVFGCGFSLVGGYLGPALLEVDKAAPFALQMGVAFITTMVLALTLGHRAMAQVVVCQTEDQYDASIEDMIKRRPSIRKSLAGLKHMRDRPDSYIGVEQRFRKHSKKTLPTIESSGSLCPIASSQSLCDMDNPQQPGESSGSPQAALDEPLLPQHSRERSFDRGVSCEAVPMLDTASSTYEARQFKKAMVNWDLAGFDIDTKDYTLETASVKQLVISHRRVRSGN